MVALSEEIRGKISSFCENDADCEALVTLIQEIVDTTTQDLQAQLQASEARFHTLFDRSPDAIFVLHPDTTVILDCNVTACEMNGYTREELIGQHINIVNYREDLSSPNAQRHHYRKLDWHGGERYETLHRHKNGKIFPVEVTTSLIEFQGRPAILGFDRDISETYAIQEELRQSESRFHDLFDNSPDAIFLIELEGRIIIDCNEMACQMNGYTRDELIGQSVHMLNARNTESPPLDDELYVERLRNVGTLRYEAFHKRKDGTVFPIEVSTRLVQVGGRQLLMGIDRDVSERKATLNALKRSEEKLRKIIDGANDGIVLLDHRGNVTTWNKQQEWLTGIAAQAAIGMGFPQLRALLTPDSQQQLQPIATQLQTHYHKLMENKLQDVVEFWIERPDKTRRFIEAAFFVIDTDASRIACEIWRDATERKALEEKQLQLAIERQKVELVANFIRDASHEFRTPLAVIQTTAYLMARSDIRDNREERLERISGQINQLTRLVDSLVLLSQLDTTDHLNLSLVHIDNMIRDLLVDFDAEFGQKQIKVVTELNVSMTVLPLDDDLIYRALGDLLDNAVRYSHQNGIITLKTRIEDNTLMIDIIDEGIGIPQAEQTQIFKRFYRVDKARKTRGFGLGLSIAQKIIELHRGTITLESQLNHGTQVHIAIPIPANR